MLDFMRVVTTTKDVGSGSNRHPCTYVAPEFVVGDDSEDLMVRGNDFYAIWDDGANRWRTDTGSVVRLVDAEIRAKAESLPDELEPRPLYMANYSSKRWTEFQNYVKSLPNHWHELDGKLLPSDAIPKREDYVTRTLPYRIDDGDISAYDELMSTLYSPSERAKIEWAIGSVYAGDSADIQKFVVLYGPGGTGKSTVIRIIQDLFDGYCGTFRSKELGASNNQFALASLASNPLVAVEHDGDLSRIQDNTQLNSLISHEQMLVNEKYHKPYVMRFRTFLFMGTNTPIRITDSKSGLLRRLIDVEPTGDTVRPERYEELMRAISFEHGSIAKHCLDVYTRLGKHAYDAYRPMRMLEETSTTFDFLVSNYDYLSTAVDERTGVTLKRLYSMYKEYCDEAGVRYPLGKQAFHRDVRPYFDHYSQRVDIYEHGGHKAYYNVLYGLNDKRFESIGARGDGIVPKTAPLVLDGDASRCIFDTAMADMPAQYASESGGPIRRWDNCNTMLKDLDTSRLHYVRVPENHIVIDFDLTDEDGNKSLDANLMEAGKWPKTYAEVSKSGAGVHLHYIYDGNADDLSRVYDDHIEIKVFTGKSSLRRQLTLCNSLPFAHISSGLPLKPKGDVKMIDFKGLQNERALRTTIKRSLRKEYQPGTKPSVEFISKVLHEYHDSGKPYDVTDMRPAITAFANNSTHHPIYCLKLVDQMPFCSDNVDESTQEWDDETLVFFDVEVFSNLFIVVWKPEGKKCVKMVNPSPSDIEQLVRMRLIGFNNRKYDNHILYARMNGYKNEELYQLSQRLVSGSHNATFKQAYGLSYTDVYDFSSKKQSLKKFEIELGIHHQELGLPWDQPVDEKMWDLVADYCVNDVEATEAVFHARSDDWQAREMLASLSGLTVNDTNRMHTTRIIFGKDRHPQDKFVYTDLSEMFPGYEFKDGHSSYRGEDPGEGGYVYSEPGCYEDVALLDIASMHPTSIIQLNLFGPYTKNFKDLYDARIAIKHKEYDKASKMLDGKLAPYLGNPEDSSKLAYALKIVINSVYGLTMARFDCEFKDPRNVDNIVAKRGALFMINLKHEVQERGFTVAHIKTDSIKIPNATPEIIQFVVDYGHKYGYNFEHEATFEKYCLVNDAVYICKVKSGEENGAGPGEWSATGKQFQVPYVFKKLFSHKELEFDDFCETRTVTGSSAIYLDMNENLPEGDHDYVFVGRAGSFVPVKPGCGGGLLVRRKDDKSYFLSGAKGYRWLESETVRREGRDGDIDASYFDSLADAARETVSKYVDFEAFVS